MRSGWAQKIPQSYLTLRDLMVFLEAMTRIELVNGGFAVLMEM